MNPTSPPMSTPTAAPPLHGLSSDDQVLGRIAEQLTHRFTGVFAAETVERYVFESYAALARTSRIRHYLVPRTQRFATDRLTALAKAKGRIASEVPEVLFICVQNAGRSQMAAALLRAQAGDRVHVRSAGSAPAEQIEPQVVEVMARRGLSLAEEFPKPLTDDVTRAADVLVTMGCGDSCPIYPGKRYLDWAIPDPAGQPVEETEKIADLLDRQVRELLHELIGEAG
jgi:arsenate reductase